MIQSNIFNLGNFLPIHFRIIILYIQYLHNIYDALVDDMTNKLHMVYTMVRLNKSYYVTSYAYNVFVKTVTLQNYTRCIC